MRPNKIVIFTGAWGDDAPADPEEARAGIEFRVFADGEEIEGVVGFEFGGMYRDFQTIKLELGASVEVRPVEYSRLRDRDLKP